MGTGDEGSPQTPVGHAPTAREDPGDDLSQAAPDETPTPAEAGGSADAWRLLRRQQDRRRYLRILTAPRTGNVEPRRPNPALGVPRDSHHLLASPAAMTRTATNFPNPELVRQYLRHSCDLTVQGGLPTSLTTPLAACALAEHYVFRRIGGAGTAGLSAAAVAAAELGRGAPDPAPDPSGSAPNGHPTNNDAVVGAGDRIGLSVRPGFAGLAELIGWLAGQAVDHPTRVEPEQWRLARLFQPSAQGRGAFRLVTAILRTAGPDRTGSHRWARVLSAVATGLSGAPAAAALTLTVGLVVAWVGLVTALARGGLTWWLVSLVGLALVPAFALAAVAGIVVSAAMSARLLLARGEAEGFGLVPGVAVPGQPPVGSLTRRLDDWAGVADPGSLPPLVTWLADRLDDLAGVAPAGSGHGLLQDAAVAVGAGSEDRRAVTFGDLWLGRVGPPRDVDADALRLAADDHEHRTVDLVLVAANLSQRRPYTFPLPTAERAQRVDGSRFLFCAICLGSALPARVVRQLLASSPAQESEVPCPRHAGAVLHELPEPWDLPVIVAARLGMAIPGLLRAVPLVTVEEVVPVPGRDEFGRRVAAAPASGLQARTHWFSAAPGAGMPVDAFDELLPRWPTFALTVTGSSAVAAPAGLDPEQWLQLPEQDAGPLTRAWQPLGQVGGVLSALAGMAAGWRDGVHADRPGLRGRVAAVRAAGPERVAFVLPQTAVLRLAARGLHAGQGLRERFTGPDGEIAEQTQTDRYRWIRLRAALREYRSLSLSIGARLPLYSDLAAQYRVPTALAPWFDPPLRPGSLDPSWADAAATVTHLRALSAGGVLDWDTDLGAPPTDPDDLVPPQA